MERLLVIGGRGGIGQAVVKQAKVQFEVGVADQEEFDLANGAQIVNFFGRTDKWDHVVVAAGVNGETSIKGINLHRSALLMAQVNYIGPMVALQAWLRKTQKPGPRGHFVVISSNSAHVARSKSLAYCASKAAVSMAVRCAARELAETDVTVWGVEPGWVEGTPMSREVLRRLLLLDNPPPPHRIPGGRALEPEQVADFILDGIVNNVQAYNGVMFRLDGSEQ